MIILDTSEQRANSITNISGDNVKSVTWLEEKTGADLMITPLVLPLVPATFEKHMKANALLVQVKHGFDFTASIGERLNTSIAKMNECAQSRYFQKILLITGEFIPDNNSHTILVGLVRNNQNGKVYIDWADSGVTEKAYDSAVRHWGFRGGLVVRLANADRLSDWCNETEKDLKNLLNNPIKEVWPSTPVMYDPPDKDDPLQLPKRVTDVRVTLATLPGVGEVRANALYKEFGNGADILCWITSPSNAKAKIKGIGDKTVTEIKNYLGVDDCMEFALEVSPDFRRNGDNGND